MDFHGAMVVDNTTDDPEGDLLKKIREKKNEVPEVSEGVGRSARKVPKFGGGTEVQRCRSSKVFTGTTFQRRFLSKNLATTTSTRTSSTTTSTTTRRRIKTETTTAATTEVTTTKTTPRRRRPRKNEKNGVTTMQTVRKRF